MKNEIKEQENKVNELTNLIMEYAIENKMSFKSVGKSVEKCKEIFLESGLMNKGE